MDDQLLGLDPRDEPGFEREHAVEPEHVGDEVVGEHRQPVEVGEAGAAGTVQVRGSDLGALEEGDGEFLIRRAVGEAVPAAESPCERRRRAVGGVDHGRDATGIVQTGAEVVERVRVQPHQLMIGVLTEDPRDVGGVEPDQPRRRERAVRLLVLAPVPRDRVVAAEAVAFAQRREPAGTEVDRIERQPVRGDVVPGVPLDPSDATPGSGIRCSEAAYGAIAARCTWTLRALAATAAQALRSSSIDHRMTGAEPSGTDANVAR